MNPQIALKIMMHSSEKSASHELAVHRALDESHPGRRHIIRLLDGFMLEKLPCLVFEMHGRELAKYLRKVGPLTVGEMRAVARQVLLGLDALHSAGFAHGDIKPGNILWDPESKAAKLIDLGWARYSYERGQSIATCDYCPPEMLLGLDMTSAVDLWSLGCTLFELLTKTKLFDPHAVCEEKYREFNSYTSESEPEDTKEELIPPFSLEEGSIVAGRYHLRSRLGSGKCGEVWLADMSRSDRTDGSALTPKVRIEKAGKKTINPAKPPKLSVWEVAIGYEHFLQMQTHLGVFPPELARQGKFHYILFTGDGCMRFKPEIKHVPISERLTKEAGLDAATAGSVEKLLLPMLALDSTKRPSAREMLRMLE